MKKLLLLTILCFTINTFAQVGINTTTPQAQLEIKASNQATPTNKDGILIPKVDVFPATNPTVDSTSKCNFFIYKIIKNIHWFFKI